MAEGEPKFDNYQAGAKKDIQNNIAGETIQTAEPAEINESLDKAEQSPEVKELEQQKEAILREMVDLQVSSDKEKRAILFEDDDVSRQLELGNGLIMWSLSHMLWRGGLEDRLVKIIDSASTLEDLAIVRQAFDIMREPKCTPQEVGLANIRYQKITEIAGGQNVVNNLYPDLMAECKVWAAEWSRNERIVALLDSEKPAE